MARPRPADRIRTVAPYALGVMLAGSSVLHALRPGFFRPMVPPVLGPPDPWVYGSGLAEAVVGLGLLTARPWAGRAGAALMLAVLPGNVQMALDAGTGRTPGPQDNRIVAWGRLPLQAPLVWAALQSRPRTTR